MDDFLKADDPRIVAEGLGTCQSIYASRLMSRNPPDITDRFDFTFLFGDLNFRLDLSRLHADWLISRRGTTHNLYRVSIPSSMTCLRICTSTRL